MLRNERCGRRGFRRWAGGWGWHTAGAFERQGFARADNTAGREGVFDKGRGALWGGGRGLNANRAPPTESTFPPLASPPAPHPNLAVWFHVVGVTAFVVILPALAPTHQSSSWVFGAFTPDKVYSGVDNSGFTFLLALLGSQWAMVSAASW